MTEANFNAADHGSQVVPDAFRTCRKCEAVKPVVEFRAPFKGKPARLVRVCVDCRRAHQRAHYQANREKALAAMRQHRIDNPEQTKERKRAEWAKLKADPERSGRYKARRRITERERRATRPELYERERQRKQQVKRLVLEHYSGGACQCACCGESHFEFLSLDHINNDGAAHRREVKGHVYPWIVKNNFPGGFRVLCINCNFSLGKFGYCPHQVNKKLQ